MCSKAFSAGVRIDSIKLIIFMYELGAEYFGIHYCGKISPGLEPNAIRYVSAAL